LLRYTQLDKPKPQFNPIKYIQAGNGCWCNGPTYKVTNLSCGIVRYWRNRSRGG
jgi:hypothetical protein